MLSMTHYYVEFSANSRGREQVIVMSNLQDKITGRFVREVWTDDKINILKSNFGVVSNCELAEMLGLTAKQIKTKVSKLGLRRVLGIDRRVKVHWTEEMDNVIIDNFGKLTDNELADKLGINQEQLMYRKKILRKFGTIGFVKVYKISSTVDGKSLDEFLLLNHKSMSTEEIANRFGISESSVHNYRLKLGLDYKRFWDEEKTEVIINEYGDTVTSELLEKLGTNRPCVSSRARMLGIRKLPGYRNRLYKVDHNYFKNIDSPDKAYFLGFLWADGHVEVCRGSYSMKLEIQKRDLEIIENFRSFINSNYPIKHYSVLTKMEKVSEMISLCVNSKWMFDDLVDKGVIPRKSWLAGIPKNIPENLISHFMRGVFDGDGCICITRKPNGLIKNAQFIICGTGVFCRWCLDTIRRYANITGGNVYAVKGCYITRIQGLRQVRKVARFIYRDSIDKIRLARKYNIFVDSGLLESDHEGVL